MKRIIFIVAGLIIILVLIAVWAYFLFFSTPNPDGGTFADFGLGNTTDPSVVIEPEPQPTTPVVDVTSPERLRQLTTNPVIGYAEVQTDLTEDAEIRYIEAGTGHIYSINLETGEEVRVSATTIPLASKGVLTPNGRYTLIQSDSGVRADFVIGILSTTSDELRNFTVRDQVTSFAATSDNQLVYTTPVGNQLVAKVYDPSDNTLQNLFTIPFRDATVAWHHSTAGPHVVYPHASSRLEGYVYTYTDGAPTREAASGLGISAVGSDEMILYSTRRDSEYQTFIQTKGTFEVSESPLTFIPEKCLFTKNDPTIGICGATLTEYSHLMPDPWYRGTLQLNDDLWEINTQTLSANLLVSPERVTGRQVDLINPLFGITDGNLYFQNKLDQTLWMYVYNPFNQLTQ